MAEALGPAGVAALREPSILEVEGLERRFGATRALRGVDLRVAAGEVVALLGENGAGKSTLIKILAGVYEPSAGTIRLGSRVFAHGLTPADAREHGLAFVHQDLGLLDRLSVAENIAHVAGFRKTAGLISWRRQLELARQLLTRWEIDVDPAAPVEGLDPAERSLVAIARALAADAKLIVFDEPTASLAQHEVDLLYAAVDRLRAAGIGVLYVTHRLGEVLRLADRAAVLRDGALAGDVAVPETTEAELVELILGTAPPARSESPRARQRSPLLSLRQIGGTGASGVTFTLREGEILALVGLLGAGHRSVGRVVAGVERAAAGEMWLGGGPYRPGSPREAQRRGVVLVPADRLREAAFASLDTATNLTLRDAPPHELVLARRDRVAAAHTIAEWNVVPPRPAAGFGSLSGGNQQKVVIAKWLARQPLVLVAEDPTAGIDVGTKAAIYGRLRSAAGRTAVLLVSSDTDEVAALADRAIVFAHGRPKAELARAELTPERLARECFGG